VEVKNYTPTGYLLGYQICWPNKFSLPLPRSVGPTKVSTYFPFVSLLPTSSESPDTTRVCASPSPATALLGSGPPRHPSPSRCEPPTRLLARVAPIGYKPPPTRRLLGGAAPYPHKARRCASPARRGPPGGAAACLGGGPPRRLGSPTPGSGGPQRHDARLCASPARRGSPQRRGNLSRWHGEALHGGAVAYPGGTESLPDGVATCAGASPATSTSIRGEKKNQSMTYGTHVSFSAMISLGSVF